MIELNQRRRKEPVAARRRKELKKRYQHVSEMRKDMKDALRVKKAFATFLLNYKLLIMIPISDYYIIFSEIYFGIWQGYQKKISSISKEHLRIKKNL